MELIKCFHTQMVVAEDVWLGIEFTPVLKTGLATLRPLHYNRSIRASYMDTLIEVTCFLLFLFRFLGFWVLLWLLLAL